MTNWLKITAPYAEKCSDIKGVDGARDVIAKIGQFIDFNKILALRFLWRPTPRPTSTKMSIWVPFVGSKKGRGSSAPWQEQSLTLAPFVSGLMTLSLVGCQTADLDPRPADGMRPIVGMTVAEFSRYTGLVPSDEYDAEEEHVFVVTWRADMLAVRGELSAPAAANTISCRLLLVARPMDNSRGGSRWRIEETRWVGAC